MLDGGGGGGSSVAGIELPPGDPGAVRESGQSLRGVASGFQRTGSIARQAAASVSWEGVAAQGFMARTGDYGDAAGVADAACTRAGAVLVRFAERLEEGRDRVRRLQDLAEKAQAELTTALANAEDAGQREAAAQQRAFDATVGAPLDGGSFSLGEASRALEDAGSAADDKAHYEGIAQRARDELERLREQAREEREAVKDAATAAAGEVNGAQDGLPVVAGGAMLGRSGAVEDRVLAAIRAGDYGVLDRVPLNSLPEDTQRAIGAEVAKDAYEATHGGGDQSLEEVAGLVGRHDADGEFAVGFYNQLGGEGANGFAQEVVDAHDGDYSDWLAIATPFATLLGTATRSRGLRPGFAAGFVRGDLSREDEDRWSSYPDLEAFVMAGEASNYSPRFLADFGEEVMFAETGNPLNQLQYHQQLIEFTAGNPEASALLLTGTSEWRGDEYPNTFALLSNPLWDDDGAALGSLIRAGTHELGLSDRLLGSETADTALSGEASHSVIVAAGAIGDDMPAGVKPALVTILDDRIVDFEYVATERALPGVMDAPDNSIEGLSYEQGQDYLKMLFADEGTRTETSTIIGERVGEDMFEAARLQDTSYANRAGALAEMGVLGLGEAELDSAEAQDATNDLAKTASGKLLGLTPVDKVPGFDLIADQAFGDIFPTDAVEKSLEEQAERQVDEIQSVKRLAIAMQVELGQLPPEAMEMVNLDGSPNIDFVDGPKGDDDVVWQDTDGDGTPDKPLKWDFDGDGRYSAEERDVTERELYDEGLGLAEPATEGMTSLADERYAATNPPDIDDLSLPGGYDNDNPSTFEKVWEWPFDAEGEGTIASEGGDVVARQEDLQWDPAERVYRLPIEGSSEELTYKRVSGEWVRVQQVDGAWELAE